MGGITTLQKWLAGLIGLGALYIVAANPTAITKAFGAAQNFISGTEGTAIGRNVTPAAA